MPTHEFEKPWQVMPAKIIKLALEHAEKKDDFDHQIAFLLLDIGVEASLKTFLANRGHDIERINFPGLLQKVKEELSKTDPKFTPQIDEVGYFHGIRNKLYHQGDGIKPTEDNLKRYSDLAKKIVEEVMEVDLQTEEKRYIVDVNGYKHVFEDLIGAITTRFDNFRESCAVVAEKTRPAFATREFAMKLKYIEREWQDYGGENPEHWVDNRSERLEKFNELTSGNQTSHTFVDFLLEDINHFYVIIALQQVGEDWEDNWNKYMELNERRSKLLDNWKLDIQSKRLTIDQVREEFEKITVWLEDQQDRLDQWIANRFEKIYKSGKSIDRLDWDW